MSARDRDEFALLTFAGLGGVALQELVVCSSRQSNVERLPNYDFVRCVLESTDVAKLPALRTVEDVFWLMGAPQRVSTRRDLSKLDTLVSSSVILKGLELRNRLFRPKKPGRPSFNCFVKQDRDRRVRRKDIARRVNAAIWAAFPKWTHSDPATIELWAFYIDERLHLGFRLSDERMRYRAQVPVLREGALRPTIAAALIRTATPRRDEFVLDPMCGTGTILSEGVVQEMGASFAGGDNDKEAVELTTRRLRGHGVCVQRWNATNLPLGASSIDCIVCNLPFGRQYSTRANNRGLYPALIQNWTSRLKPDGRMVLLTADSRALESALRQHGLPWRAEWRVKVLGLWATTYKVRKTFAEPEKPPDCLQLASSSG